MQKKIKQPYIIDVEASGFGDNSYPIEVGVALEDGERFCSLISRSNHWQHWDDQAEQTHGITRDQLEQHGAPVRDVANRLNQLLDGKTVFTDGWVVDKPWLTKLFHTARIPMRFHVSPLEMILTESQMAKWHATKHKIELEHDVRRHRASNDAWLIQETFKQTLD